MALGPADDLPWAPCARLDLDDAGRAAKRAAVAAHASQVRPLSAAPGDEVLLGPDLLAHFDRDGEVFLLLDEPVEDDALDQVHRERPDPWQVDSAYERRKRALTLASLPRERYRSALEVGCSVGALAVDLAGRCDRVLAIDDSATAIDLARRRTAGIAHLEVRPRTGARPVARGPVRPRLDLRGRLLPQPAPARRRWSGSPATH